MTNKPTPGETEESTANDPPASGDDVAESDGTAVLEKDLVFEILKNHRRRRVLQYLREHGETDLGNLAEQIAAEENDTTVAELSADERKRVYIGLYQTHLPKMDDAGIIVYEQSNGVVSAGPAIEQLAPYLETAAGDDTAASTNGASSVIDLSGLAEPVTLPAWGLLSTVLVVGLLTVAATTLPGPVWAAVLVVAGLAVTFLVRWG